MNITYFDEMKANSIQTDSRLFKAIAAMLYNYICNILANFLKLFMYPVPHGILLLIH